MLARAREGPVSTARRPPGLAARRADRRAGERFGNAGLSALVTRREPVRAKLDVGSASDPLEREADATADEVVRMKAGGDCAACARGDPCDGGAGATVRRAGEGSGGVALGPAAAARIRRATSGGEPLPGAVRRSMEPRFGADFSGVRIHRDAAAADSARSIGARAYTLGSHIAFGAGQWAPGSDKGDRLIAHELTHTLQDGGGAAPSPSPVHPQRARPAATKAGTGHGTEPRVRRACGPRSGDARPDCAFNDDSISSLGQHWTFRFVVDCDDLQRGEAEHFARIARLIPPKTQLRVHGYASEEGPSAYNLALSCRRARMLTRMLRAARPDCTVSETLMHGEAGTKADRSAWRAVLVEWVEPAPPRREEPENCAGHLGTCAFYECRDRLHPCGPQGYYLGYGLKYCNRFKALRTRTSRAGAAWVDRTLLCLQQHIHRNVPIAADCARAWRSAYDSHPGCYVRGGICTLGAAELLQILATIDLADLEARQALITALSCGGMGISMMFPATSLGVGGGFRGLMERDRARQRQLMNPPPP